MDYSKFEPINFTSDAERDALTRRYGQNVPYVKETDYSWMRRTYEQIHAYNTLSLLSQEGSISNSYEELDYNPAKDPAVTANQWISGYYPEVWQSLLESNSSAYTQSVIKNVSRNHKSAEIIGSGGLVGNLAGSLVAGIFDPINWIFPTAGILAKGGSLSKQAVSAVKGMKQTHIAQQTAGLTLRQKAQYAAIDNMVTTSIVEPLMQAKNMTRTEQDYLYDLVGSAVFGAGLNVTVSKMGDGLNTVRENVTMRMVGAPTIEEAMETAGERIVASVNRQIEDLPLNDARKVEQRMNNIEDFLDAVRDNPEDLEFDMKLYDNAFNEVFPNIGEVSGLGKLVKWFIMNPNQQLLKTGSRQVIDFTTNLLEGNLHFEGSTGRVPIESKIKLVDFVMKRQIGEFGSKFDDYAHANREMELTPDKIREMVYYLVVSGQDTVEGAMNRTFKVNNNGDLIDAYVFKDIFGKQVELGNQSKLNELSKFIEDQADVYRGIVKTLDNSLNSAGVLSSVMRSADDNPLNLMAYVSRWISEEGAHSIDLFVRSVDEGIVQRHTTIKGQITKDLRQLSDELNSYQKIVEEGGLSHWERSRLRNKMEISKEKIKSAENELAELQKLIDDPVARELFAKRIVNNYTLSYDKNIVGARGFGSGNTTQEILSRRVDISDTFLSPFVVRDPAATLDKARMHLVPKIVLADDLLNRYGGTRGINFNRSLGQQMDKLAELEEDMKLKSENGEIVTEADASLVKNLQDDILDDIATSRLINEAMMIADLSDLNKAMNAEFSSLERAIKEILDLNASRKEKRKKASEILNKLKETEQEIENRSTYGSDLSRLIKQKSYWERELSFLDTSSYDDIGSVYAEVLNQGFIPEGRSDLESRNRLDDSIVEVIFDGTDVRHQVMIDGVLSDVTIREAPFAKSPGRPNLDIIDDVTLVYWFTNDGRWGWANPLELQDATRIQHAKALRDSPRVTDQAKINSAMRKIEKNRPEFKEKEDSILLKQYFFENIEDQRSYINETLSGIYENIGRNIDELDLVALSKKHTKLHEDFRSMYKDMNQVRSRLNDFADGVHSVIGGKKQFEDMGLGKPSLRRAMSDLDEADELSMFDYIGYEDNFKYYKQYGWHPVGLSRSLSGASNMDLRIGYSDFRGDLYNISKLAQAQRNANISFILNPQWMIESIKREGSVDLKDLENVTANIGFIFNQLQNKDIASGVGADVQKMTRIVRNMNYMRYMGMVTISSLGDFSNAIGTLGMTRYVRTLFDTYGDWKDRKNQNSIAGVIAAAEEADINYRNTQMYGVDGEATYVDPITGNPYSAKRKGGWGLLDKADNLFRSDSGVSKTYNRYGNFLGRWNAFNKRVVTLGLEDMLIEIAIKQAKGQPIRARDKGILEALRFEESDLAEIYTRWNKADQDSNMRARKSKIIGRDFYLANSADWDDVFGYQYLMKVQSAVDTIIVTPSLGDLPKAFRNPALSPFLQFKSFMFAQTQKMLLPAIQRGVLYKDPNQLMMVFATAMLGTMSYGLHELTSGRDLFADSSDGVSWERKALLQGIDRGGMFALLFEMSNTFERHTNLGFHSLFGGELDKRYRSRTMSDTLLGPFGSFMTDVGKSVTLFGDLLTGKEVGEGQLTAFRRLWPFQNAILSKTLFDNGLTALDVMGSGPALSGDSTYRRYMDNYMTFQGRVHSTFLEE